MVQERFNELFAKVIADVNSHPQWAKSEFTLEMQASFKAKAAQLAARYKDVGNTPYRSKGSSR